ncbi:SDR family NAD(P)-dependent oxidoreductase [Listeria weihenstephanensis]|uniref:SDR family NAD(P)-dependent oxidoreductase n=1 Tax=Listeria weihenstephanensis TaxID=1006155 RepID=A0A841ZB26_9LIST|nr:SDR family NAD(P)-dependent oxidoreductase [Listeria weihenstephanensis]MBC1502059.1 SDR family NAD(P)-dependent oxidoreductase [Listeria weihenstephanensis]
MSDNESTILITGGNSGLGFETAKKIATKSKEYQIILACRNLQKAEVAVKNLIDTTSNENIRAMELDVSSIESVRKFAATFKKEKLGPIEGLLCNAGINGMHSGLTPDGFDIVFETNHLGHFLLSNLLLSEMKPKSRIVVVSSDMHSPPGPELTWPGVGALAHPDEQLKSNFIRYSYSKLCNLYFTHSLASKLARMDSEIVVNAFNPGLLTDTNFALDKSRFTDDFLEQVSDRIGNLEDSTEALANMMTEPLYGEITGKFIDRGTEKLSSPLSYSASNAEELWEKSVEYTGLTPNETIPNLLTM